MMPALEPPKLVIEFRGERADFQSPDYRARIERVHRAADSLQAKAHIDRERLRVRAKL
jgi:hypothetical protein